MLIFLSLSLQIFLFLSSDGWLDSKLRQMNGQPDTDTGEKMRNWKSINTIQGMCSKASKTYNQLGIKIFYFGAVYLLCLNNLLACSQSLSNMLCSLFQPKSTIRINFGVKFWRLSITILPDSWTYITPKIESLSNRTAEGLRLIIITWITSVNHVQYTTSSSDHRSNPRECCSVESGRLGRKEANNFIFLFLTQHVNSCWWWWVEKEANWITRT